MKRSLAASIFILLFFSACASSYYARMARQQDFSYFFPSHSFTRNYNSVEEAYEYVRTAQAKFSSSLDKPLAKGLAAKLIGPEINAENLVTLGCYMIAGDGNTNIDLSKTGEPIEDSLENAVSVYLVFMLFYNGRGISIPQYYLKESYEFLLGGLQVESYRINNMDYKAEYTENWSIDDAFDYLLEEAD